jgi:galactitol-specific phosphotransferase system IIB component
MKKLLSITLITALFTLTSSVYAQTKIALISQLNGASASVDVSIQKYLQAQGYQVEVFDQTVTPNSLNHPDLVILSSTVASKNLKSGWRQLPIPLMTWENDYLDDLAMTGKRLDTDFGEVEKERYLWLVNAPHPLSAHLPAGTRNVYKAQAPMSWGKPGLGATIIATIYGQPEKVAIWGYEKGATMDYESLAPAKRLMFFLNNETFPNLSEDGLKLFDASVQWLLKK